MEWMIIKPQLSIIFPNLLTHQILNKYLFTKWIKLMDYNITYIALAALSIECEKFHILFD